MKWTNTIPAIIGLLLFLSATTASVAGTTGPTPRASKGGHYVLTSVAAAPNQALTGGGRYTLSPAQPSAGEGCCCKTFLPCVRKGP